jgi:hypothetical protein
MTKVLTLIVVTVALLNTAASPQNADFDRKQLSLKGRVAYDRLYSACVFRIGGVGYAGVTSQEELALYDLLEDEHAIEALKSLVTAGTYEGGLYGLLGLSLKNNGEFNRAVDIYKARNDERPSQEKGPFECSINDKKEYVSTQDGCILSVELRADVVTRIQSGRYDAWISRRYKRP